MRNLRDNRLVDGRVRPDGAAKFSFDKTRRNCVHLDIVRCQLSGQHFGEHNHRRFADTVDAHPRLRNQTRHRGNVDNLAPTAALHAGGTGFGDPKVPFDVDIQNLVPMALFGGEKRPKVRIGGRVVNSNIDTAKGVDRLLHK